MHDVFLVLGADINICYCICSTQMLVMQKDGAVIEPAA